MSSLSYLREKYCACCNVRLDLTNKTNLRHIKKSDLIEKLNSVKNTILNNKGRTNNNIDIKENDIICKACITYANKHGTIGTNTSVATTSTGNLSRSYSFEQLYFKQNSI